MARQYKVTPDGQGGFDVRKKPGKFGTFIAILVLIAMILQPDWPVRIIGIVIVVALVAAGITMGVRNNKTPRP